MANVVGIFAHADDETLGCGGTLAKHAEQGDKIRVLILSADGRPIQFENAAKAIGFTANVGSLDALDGTNFDQKFDHLGVKYLTDFIADWDLRGDIIYTHHPGDLNQDHALTAQAVLTVFRPKPDALPCRIMACEVASSTEWTFPPQFQPNWFEALSVGHMEKKWKALKCYPSEVMDPPHPRSGQGIMNQAAVRGQQCGAVRAEAFQLLRAGPF